MRPGQDFDVVIAGAIFTAAVGVGRFGAAAKRVCEDGSRKSPALVVLKKGSSHRANDNRLTLEGNSGAPGRIRTHDPLGS